MNTEWLKKMLDKDYFAASVWIALLMMCLVAVITIAYKTNTVLEEPTIIEYMFTAKDGHSYVYMREVSESNGTIIHSAYCKKCFEIYD